MSHVLVCDPRRKCTHCVSSIEKRKVRVGNANSIGSNKLSEKRSVAGHDGRPQIDLKAPFWRFLR